jgi:hypothetical protein
MRALKHIPREAAILLLSIVLTWFISVTFGPITSSSKYLANDSYSENGFPLPFMHSEWRENASGGYLQTEFNALKLTLNIVFFYILIRMVVMFLETNKFKSKETRVTSVVYLILIILFFSVIILFTLEEKPSLHSSSYPPTVTDNQH